MSDLSMFGNLLFARMTLIDASNIPHKCDIYIRKYILFNQTKNADLQGQRQQILIESKLFDQSCVLNIEEQPPHTQCYMTKYV